MKCANLANDLEQLGRVQWHVSPRMDLLLGRAMACAVHRCAQAHEQPTSAIEVERAASRYVHRVAASSVALAQPLRAFRRTLKGIQPQFLPTFDQGESLDAPERFPYGARSAAAVYVGDLLCEHAPGLASVGGNLDIVAIARRPGVLSKVALRARSGAPAPLLIGIGADSVRQVRDKLDGERIHIVTWQRSASGYIADALGLGTSPPMLLLPGIGHARVLLGEIDLRGIAGWRGLNAVLASALTGWRIRLEPVAATHAWRRLETAMLARRSVSGTVVGRTDRGMRVEVLGLYAVLSGARALAEQRTGQEIEVRITRMDPDEGRIFVSDHLETTGQLRLPLAETAVVGAARSSNTVRG